MWGITISLIVIAVCLFLIWRKRKFSIFKRLGIPGPEPNLLFGNLLEMLKTSPLDCHEKWIKKYGKVVGTYVGGNPVLVVADLDLAKQILIKDFHKFPNRPFVRNDKSGLNVLPNQLIALINRRWKEIRSIITPTFTTSKMRMMIPLMNGAIDSLMNIIEKNAKSGSIFNIYQLYQRLTLDIIGRSAFGIQTDVQNNRDDRIYKAIEIAIGEHFGSTFFIITNSLPELRKVFSYLLILTFILKGRGNNAITDLINHARNILALRRKNKEARRPDFLQIMIDASIPESSLSNMTFENLASSLSQKELDKAPESETKDTNDTQKDVRYMNDDEIIDNILLFLIAGYDTTSSALAFTTHFLIQYPEIQEKIRSEIHNIAIKEESLDYNSVQKLKFLDQVMMESLRMYPPICLFVNREAEEDVQYGKYEIPKGMAIQIPVFNFNHDPDLWQNPQKFDPTRFSPENKSNINPLAFQTFGIGPRNCVGMRFAQLEMKLTLATILSKYNLVAVEETDKEPLPLHVGAISISPANGIKLKAVPI